VVVHCGCIAGRNGKIGRRTTSATRPGNGHGVSSASVSVAGDLEGIRLDEERRRKRRNATLGRAGGTSPSLSAHDGDASQPAMATAPKAVGGASRLARPTRAISASRLYSTGEEACPMSR